jgi:hypothetical protein
VQFWTHDFHDFRESLLLEKQEESVKKHKMMSKGKCGRKEGRK